MSLQQVIVVTLKITDHSSPQQIHIIIRKSLKYCENYQNVTQRRKGSKYFCNNDADRFAQCRLATNLWFVKDAVPPKHSKAKCNKRVRLYLDKNSVCTHSLINIRALDSGNAWVLEPGRPALEYCVFHLIAEWPYSSCLTIHTKWE